MQVQYGTTPGGPYPSSAVATTDTFTSAQLCGGIANSTGYIYPGKYRAALCLFSVKLPSLKLCALLKRLEMLFVAVADGGRIVKRVLPAGILNTATMQNLTASTTYYYRVGDSVRCQHRCSSNSSAPGSAAAGLCYWHALQVTLQGTAEECTLLSHVPWLQSTNTSAELSFLTAPAPGSNDLLQVIVTADMGYCEVGEFNLSLAGLYSQAPSCCKAGKVHA